MARHVIRRGAIRRGSSRRGFAWPLVLVTTLLSLAGCSGHNQPRVESRARAEATATQDLLDRRVSVDVRDATLSEVVQQLSLEVGVPIRVDRQSTAAAARRTRSPSPAATDKRLTLRVADVRLESALCLALSSEMPSATWRDGELVIALGAAAPARMESAVHPIPRSLLEPIHGFDEQRIAELVSSIVVPESWDDVGGPGHVRAVPGALIVAQTHELQQDIAAVLTALHNVAVARQPWSPELAASAASPASAAIVRALDSRVTLRADDQPVEEFLNAVAAEHGINVVIDRQTWWEEKLANRCRVSVDARDMRLRDALRQALADCHLTFFLWHEALLVTSMHEASEALRMHFYPLPEGVNEPDEFMDVLTLHVEPESWDDVGGPGMLERIPAGLAVWQPSAIQEEVAAFVADFERANDPLLIDYDTEERAASHRDYVALDVPISLRWDQEPLEFALRDVAKAAGFDVLRFNRPTFEAKGVHWRDPVTMRFEGVPAWSAIEMLIPSTHVAVEADAQTLSIDVESARRHTRFYRAAFLKEDHREDPAERLIELMESHDLGPGDRETWYLDWASACGDLIVVTLRPRDHENVRHMLRGLAWLRAAPSGASRVAALADDDAELTRIRHVLARPVTVDARARPLDELLTDLAREQQVSLQLKLEPRNLRYPTVKPDRPVSLHVTDVSLQAALDLLLRDHLLDATLSGNVLRISHKNYAWRASKPRFYSLRPHAAASDETAVARIVRNLVSPIEWSFRGGQGDIDAVPGGLVVTQSTRVDRQVEVFLEELLWVLDGSPGDQPPMMPEAALRVRRALASPVGRDVGGLPLEIAVEQLAVRHQVNVLLDEALNIGIRAVVVPEAKHDGSPMSLAETLDAMLPVDALDWVIQDESILVTWNTAAERSIVPRVYDVAALLAPEGGWTGDELLAVARSLGKPPSDGVAPLEPELLANALVVSLNRRGHEELRRLLAGSPENSTKPFSGRTPTTDPN